MFVWVSIEIELTWIESSSVFYFQENEFFMNIAAYLRVPFHLKESDAVHSRAKAFTQCECQ